MHWEHLVEEPTFDLRRSGRFLVADLKGAHLVLSTSVRHGGQVEHVRHLLNHQSCEGAAHHNRHQVMTGAGLEAYHDTACAEAALPAEQTAMMGTAANMNYVAVVREADEGVSVTAAVTAGVEGNATAAGEPATWRETGQGMQKVPTYAGTINTLLVVNRPLTPGALARVVITMTEGKSAALHRLAVPSRLHIDLATGTGTDQYCVGAPLAGAPVLTSASPHMKLGELIGLATRKATMEALRWQNGLEASYTRGVFHALGRFGVREATIGEDIAPFLSEADLELFKRNLKPACYEPLVGAAAHALATVCDRVRYGTLPAAVAADAMVQQAAALAANLAAQVHRWAEFRAQLRPYAGGDVKQLVLRALALGWSEKMAHRLIAFMPLLWPDPSLLAAGVVIDLLAGDPVYAWHPIRLIGRLLSWIEARLRQAGLDGYGGGILLFAALASASLGTLVAIVSAAAVVSPTVAWAVHALLLYSLLALGDLIRHVWRIERAVRAGDLPGRA